MKVEVLLKKIKEFKDRLNEHFELWGNSLNNTIPDYPIRNSAKLKEQQIQLFRLYYQLDEYLTKFSKCRLMRHPATGIEWDVYQSSIGNDVAQIKGPSLSNALLELEGIIGILEGEDQEKEIMAGRISREDKRVFISHGGETKALVKIERFLRGLGITPLIVKHEPSLGKSLDDLVEEQMDTCIAVIILATKDDKIKNEKGEEYYQPRPNVIHEIGLAQEKVKDRIIYLKEEDCVFPSNISPKVWGNFTQDNMEEAFIKIAKELKAFGIIE
ncbi:MAG: nucleotide-binding protein [Deltaproteobacteria bacterium]|nr:nucleotide-binding protein [Deltaproteobacteria bacterium]